MAWYDDADPRMVLGIMSDEYIYNAFRFGQGVVRNFAALERELERRGLSKTTKPERPGRWSGRLVKTLTMAHLAPETTTNLPTSTPLGVEGEVVPGGGTPSANSAPTPSTPPMTDEGDDKDELV